ncbi:MAG TPA: ferritin family protein [Azospirillum sp.]|nr:ferritin family protein [Azospirillum sp.]
MALLKREPPGMVSSLDELLGLSLALEQEAVRRYIQLAAAMDQRGDKETAGIFRSLAEDERGHVASVAGEVLRLGLSPPAGLQLTWLLPPEIADSWDDLLDRTHITPYQVLAVAVLNEERAFAFYSYIAAQTTDPQVAMEAERLANEELTHAALLRRHRRRAYRSQPDNARAHTPHIATLADLSAMVSVRMAEAANLHEALAQVLLAAGDATGADLLRALAQEEAELAGRPVEPPLAGFAGAPGIGLGTLWSAAAAPCEEMSELLSDVAAQAKDEAVLLEAQRLLEVSVGHLTMLSGRRHPRPNG